PGRLESAVAMGIPQVVVPGCLDMVNFTFAEQIPEKYKGRNLYQWSPDVILMRTNEEENVQLGALLAQKINKTCVPVCVVIPMLGLSAIDREGSNFYDARANQALFQSIRSHLNNE